MKHYCGGEIIYRREEDVWYCQRCNTIHISLDEFVDDNLGNELSEELG